ncbi:flagellar hook-length control protein FliK [Peribacillus sp. NPDC096379]|uniref:flagellar hook-length control protein FliK n=1 Tax=Peribacillus sp. NPDC096379 TaxID=3364393 RepID=UPI0038104729
MNTGMVMASMPASVSKTQNQTAVKTSDNEHSFGSIFGKVILSSESEDAKPVDAEKLSEEQLSILNGLINELNAKGNNGEEEVNPNILLVDETAQLSAVLEEHDLSTMMNLLNEKIESNEEIDVIEILSILTTLANMDESQWSRVDINKIGEILTFTKLQEAMISANQITDNEAVISKTLKQQLDTILTKLESMVESEQQQSSASSTSNKTLAGEASLALIKNTYIRNFASVNQESEENLVQTPSLRTIETTQTGQSFIPQMSKLEQFVLTVEKSGQPITQEQFVKAFETILNKSSFTNANGTQKLLIQLNPEHLGSMRIELIQKDNVMVARIMATTAQAKEMLESQLQGLKHSFVGQGIQVEKIEISQQLSAFSQERFYQRDSDTSEQQNQQQDKQADEETATEFTNQFEEALLNVEV